MKLSNTEALSEALITTQDTYVFIDASNLFYGGEKSLGWKIDYLRLANLLRGNFRASKIFYYAGVRLFGFHFNALLEDSVDIDTFYTYLQQEINLSPQNIELAKQFAQVKFYRKLRSFGYTLRLKPVREIPVGKKIVFKANCDVDLTFDALTLRHEYKKVVVMTGDGDFLILLRYLKRVKEELWIIARAERTARELKRLAQDKFVDFLVMRNSIQFFAKK